MAGQSSGSRYSTEELIQKRETAKKVLATNKGLSIGQKRQLLQLIQAIDTKLGDNSFGAVPQPKADYQEKDTIFVFIASAFWIIESFLYSSILSLSQIIILITGVALLLKNRNFFLVISLAFYMLVNFYYIFVGISFSEYTKSIMFIRLLFIALPYLGIFLLSIAFVSDADEDIMKKASFLFMICSFFSGVNLYEKIKFIFTALWFAYPTRVVKISPARNVQSNKISPISSADAYCELMKHILLLIFTLGIWYFIWVYRMTGFLNCVEGEPQRDPTSQLLLCIFVPFYGIYWTYKSAQRIDTLAQENGVYSDLSTLCLITAIFVGIVPPVLMQDKLNTIVTKSQNGY